jgi:hypothetical protein
MHEGKPVADNSAPLARQRYRVDAVLGQGGMGTVYAVTDVDSGRQLALKRPRAQPERSASRGTPSEALHKEYQLLAELSHPSIIQVFDYGLDERGPYYTMELLSGPSLAAHGVIDWHTACELARDIASSLAVIHARRLVHRDVTLRNVHFDAAQGRYKLLDFGAVMSCGVAASIIGTPPYLPPQVFEETPLDGRTDLFALGACLYHLLTGRHAYPAQRTDELPSAWKERPLPPDALDASLPSALSELVMALLSLDPLARPNTAAEVMDRLSALAGLELREPPAVRRAYLTTPGLVGRARALQQVHAFATHGGARGGSLMISGASGIGRSRILDACAAEARAAGMYVVQVATRDAQADYALAQALVEATLRAVPEAAEAALAGQLLPLPGNTRRDGLNGLLQLLTSLAARRPLLLTVDDIDRADEPSAALLVALSEDARELPLRLVLSVASDRTPHARDAVSWLQQASTRVELANLTREQVLELLTSVFGDAPNVRLLSDRIYAISGGHPQWVMQLAEHLVEHGIVRYEAGAFIAPEQLALADIPRTLYGALLGRLGGTSDTARMLADAFMLEPDAWFSAAELAASVALAAPAAEHALDELVQVGVLSRDGQRFGLRHHALANALREHASPALHAQWHARLGGLFALRGDAPRAAQQLWAAGDRAAAVGLLARWSASLTGELGSDPAVLDRVIATMPAGFLATLDSAVDACMELRLPKRSELDLRCACVHVGAVTFDGAEAPHLVALLAQLRMDAGLDRWEQLAHVADPHARLMQALQETEARHDALAENERGFARHEALRVLAFMIGHGTAICTQARDQRLADALPSLAPLYPALAVIDELVATVRHVMAGRVEIAFAGYRRILDQVDGVAGAALDPSLRRYIQLAIWFTLGLDAAERGQPEALTWADKLERELVFEFAAWRVRMCWHRVRGDAGEAERCRRKAELLRIQHRPHQHLGGTLLWYDLMYCLASENLMSLKRLTPEVESLAQRFDGWKPVLAIAQAETLRLRGDLRAALARFEQAHALADEHSALVTPMARSGRLGALLGLGRLEEARTLAHRWLAELEAAGAAESSGGIVSWLALTEAALGNRGVAISLADMMVRGTEAAQVTGVHAGLAHETRARVAIMLGEAADFERARSRCAAELKRGSDPAMSARYERLLRDAHSHGVGSDAEPQASHSFGDSHAPEAVDAESIQLRAALATCRGLEERARCLLEALACDCEASSGLLYVAANGAMSLRASYGTAAANAGLDSQIEALCGRGLERQPGQITSPSLEATAEAAPHGPESPYRSFLLTDERSGETLLVGIALLEPGFDRTAGPSKRLLRLATETLLELGDCLPLRLR